jgi:hypothetical protein
MCFLYGEKHYKKTKKKEKTKMASQGVQGGSRLGSVIFHVSRLYWFGARFRFGTGYRKRFYKGCFRKGKEKLFSDFEVLLRLG